MATISRVVKGNGTQAWEDGDNFPASEINGDLDAVLNGVNGNLDNGNITALANIAVTKVGDNSADDATQNLTVSPGDSLSTSLPSDLKGEIERLRHRIKMNTAGTNLKARNAAGAMVDLAWTEPPPVGPNLFPNSGFETQTDGAGTAPDYWALSGSPTTCVIQAASNDVAGTTKTSLNIIGSGVGITYTLAGLKSDTKYRIGCEYERTALSFSVVTSGGLGVSADYGDISFTDAAGTGLQHFNGVLKTDSSGTDIVVTITVSGGASAEVNLFRVWAQEMSDSIPVHTSIMPITFTEPVAGGQTLVAVTGGSPSTQVVTATELEIYIPCAGYWIEYECVFTAQTIDPQANWAPQLQMQIDSGGWVEVQRDFYSPFSGVTEVRVRFRYIVNDVNPGSTYMFRVAWDQGPEIGTNSAFIGGSYSSITPRRY